MRVIYPDHEDRLDFLVPTLDEALAYIADGAINGVELLEDAGMTTAEAEASAGVNAGVNMPHRNGGPADIGLAPGNG